MILQTYLNFTRSCAKIEKQTSTKICFQKNDLVLQKPLRAVRSDQQGQCDSTIILDKKINISK